MFRYLLGICLLGLTAAGCVTTKAVILDPSATQYEQVDPVQVRIFTSEDELTDYEYVRIAIVSSEGDANWTSRAQMIESMRKKAGETGANAILIPEIKEPEAGAKVAGAFLGTVVNRFGEVIAIRIIGKK